MIGSAWESVNNNISGEKLTRFLTITAFFLLFYLLTLNLIDTTNPRSSLYVHCILGFVVVALFTQTLIKSLKVTSIILIAYVVKFILGYSHYMIFVDPNYFEHPTMVVLTVVDDFVSQLGFITYFIDNNISFWDVSNIEFKHPELFWIMAKLFERSGVFILTIIPVNILSSSLIAIFTTYIVKIRGYSNYPVAAVLSAFLPMSLFSDNFFRDLLGMSLVLFCFVVINLVTKRFFLFALIFTAYVLSLNRMPYLVVPFVGLYLYSLFNKHSSMGSKISVQIVLCILFIVGWSFVSDIFFGNQYGGYLGYVKNPVAYILFPIKYFVAIVGLFPWTQFFSNPMYYNFSEVFHSASMFYISLIVFPFMYNQYRLGKKLDYFAFCGLIILLMGALNSTPHLGYLSWGTCLFIPTILDCFQKKKFIQFHIKYLAFMILLNLIWIGFGFHGSGLGVSIFN